MLRDLPPAKGGFTAYSRQTSFTTHILPWLALITSVFAVVLSSATFILLFLREGPEGPRGPEGPQGPEGPASTVEGPEGPQGPQGDDASGDYVPTISSSTDNAVVRWNSTDGNTVQNSGVLVSDANDVSTPGTMEAVDQGDGRHIMLGSTDSSGRLMVEISASADADPAGTSYGGNGTVLHVGQSETQGANNTISEGVHVWAQSPTAGLPMNQSNYGHSTVKANSVTLTDTTEGTDNEYFEVDEDSMHWRAAADDSTSPNEFEMSSGQAAFGGIVGAGSRSPLGGGFISRRPLKVYSADVGGSFTVEDVLYYNIVFTAITTTRQWLFPSSVSLEAALPFANTTGAYWQFLLYVDNGEGTGGIYLRTFNNYTVVGAESDGASIGVVCRACFAIVHVYRLPETAYKPTGSFATRWSVFADIHHYS